jgi:hypothetical protein
MPRGSALKRILFVFPLGLDRGVGGTQDTRHPEA